MMVIYAVYWTTTLSLIITVKQHYIVTPFGHIILIASKPVVPLTPKCNVLSGEASNSNFIARQGVEPTIYRTRG